MIDNVRVVAAVDFGTHGTGFAWSLRNDPSKEIFYHDQWQGQPLAYPKNLSALLLDAKGEVVEWGYEAKRRQLADSSAQLSYHAHFKMSLQPNGCGPDPGGPDALRLTTLCLRQIYQFALHQITSRATVRPEEIGWLLTVPAIWRDRERQLMRMAAERAGFPVGQRLELVIEPEAAAQHCWDDAAFQGIATPGNRFLVVDAGSGTVDITSYEVKGSREHPKLAELSRATGGKLGASVVDAQFLGPIVQSRLGQETSWALLADSASRLKLMDEWERAKRDFDPRRGTALNVTLPPMVLRKLYTTDEQTRARLAAAQNNVDDSIVLQPTEAQTLFDHAIEPMLTLVREHLGKIRTSSPTYLLLVGGFAESRYLQERFRKTFTGRVTEVLIAPQPAYAVLLGAVKAGLRPAIVSRVSRFTYGVNTSMPFERGVDPKSRKFTDGYGVKRCSNRFSIFVKAGESIAVGATKKQDFNPTGPQDTRTRLQIFTSEAVDPRYTDSPGSTAVGELTVDVSSTVGRPSAQRTIRLTMTFGHTEITVSALDLSTGTELTTTIDFVTSS